MRSSLAGISFLILLLSPAVGTAQSPGVRQIAFGVRHAVALRDNGDVITWGNNVMCQLGRRSGNRDPNAGHILRNAVSISAAAEHSMAVTRDGHVYGWGMNAEGQLGVGNEYDQCEGPALVESLEGKGIVQIATGGNFSVALSRGGQLFCAGANDMGQCPVAKGAPEAVFNPIVLPPGAGPFVAVSAGAYHALALTKDGRLFAFGRGRDGQLGNGKTVNGAGGVEMLANVVSFGAGVWHSAAVTADGTAWAWGNNAKSQLCDGATTNRATPGRVTLPGGAKAVRVTAGGHTTIVLTGDGAIFACGDNQFGGLGLGAPMIVPTPMRVAVPPVKSTVVVAGGNYAAISLDGCAVHLTGNASEGIVTPDGFNGSRTFVARANVTLCGPKAATTLADVVNPAPRGGRSGCSAPMVNEDASNSTRFTALRQAMLTAEGLILKNPAFAAPLEPVRWRTSLSIGEQGGARMHIKVVPERKMDGTRLWTGDCGVIPQIDRIGGAISQISIFINDSVSGSLIGASGQEPKLTGRVAGFPEYNHWVILTKDGRLPWIPVTLAEKLDVEGAKRERALAEWKKDLASKKGPDEAATLRTYEMLKKSDPGGAEKFLATMRESDAEVARLQRDIYPLTTASLERRVQEYHKYRAALSAEALRSPAVYADTTGAKKQEMEARIAALRNLTPADQQRADELTKQANALGRQAQAEAAKKNTAEATRLRAESNALGLQVRDIRQRHMERVSPLIAEELDRYNLTNLVAGPADRAISVKPDPTFPDPKDPNRIQLIAILFSEDPNTKNVERRAWQQRVKQTFDFAALAALLK